MVPEFINGLFKIRLLGNCSRLYHCFCIIFLLNWQCEMFLFLHPSYVFKKVGIGGIRIFCYLSWEGVLLQYLSRIIIHENSSLHTSAHIRVFLYVCILFFCYLWLFQQEDRADITANSLHPGAIVTNLFRHNSTINGKPFTLARKLNEKKGNFDEASVFIMCLVSDIYTFGLLVWCRAC